MQIINQTKKEGHLNKSASWIKYLISMVALVAIVFFVAKCKDYTPPSNSGNNDSTCTAPTAWFAGQKVPPPDPNIEPTTNCDFHQISWHYFLWLTEAVDSGQLRFETLYSDASINPNDKYPTKHILGGVQQAESNAILVDQNGRAVYTELLINDVYRDWVIANHLYIPDSLYNFPDTSDFPIGSFSLKAGWKIVGPNDDVSKYYTTTADIELLSNVNGQVVIPQNPKIQRNVKVALVSFHIAVVVKGHPEFIWATFENVNNAPDFKENQKMNEPVSDKDFMFYKANTVASDCNVNNTPIIKLNEATQILTPVTEVARQFIHGGGTTQNQENIVTLNESIHKQLPANSMWQNYEEVGAVWFNTTKGVLVPNWTPNSDTLQRITGSTKLSNSTIETFTQNIVSQNECFSCHNTTALTSTPDGIRILPGKNASTSHILLKNYVGGYTLIQRSK